MKKKKSKWKVYMIKCKNSFLYTGISTDVERRFIEHQYNDKKASKYCKLNRPLKLVYVSDFFNNRSCASKEECRIKKLDRKKKMFLVENKKKPDEVSGF